MQGLDLLSFPNLKRWFDRMSAREAVQRGRAVGEELRKPLDTPNAHAAREALFGRRA